ncbi:MAG: cobalt ABC transporter permease [Geobacteraceae bacterium]|nr:cobalt ABC transporter permease [Geobacteraceae bacterium]
MARIPETMHRSRAPGRFKQTLAVVSFLPLISFSLVPLALYPGRAFGAEKWPGVDESVVEKFASERGREAHSPLINTDQGDLLLFVFLLGGTIGGFAAGYSWRMLSEGKTKGTESEEKQKS